MRILHINKFFYERGGAERYFFALTKILEAHGHTVIPFAMQDPANHSSPWARFFPSRVDFANPHGRGALKSLGRMFWSYEVERQLSALIRTTRPEVAHLHNLYHHLAPLTVLRVLQRHHIPVVQTLHDYKLVAPNYTLFDRHGICERAKHGLWQTVMGRCTRGSFVASAVEALEMAALRFFGARELVAQFITPSNFLRGKLMEWGIPGEKMMAVPLPTPAEQEHRPLGEAVLFLGRLSPEKGVAVLLHAWKRLATDAELYIAGTGPDLLALHKLSATLELKNVTFLGRVSRAHLPGIFARARCLVVPSRCYEVSPYVILEAGARGIPVVAASIGGIPELVQHEKTGLLVPSNDPIALAAAIKTLLANREQAELLGTALRAQVRSANSEERHYQTIFSLYERLARPHPKT